ncbi:MAG: hypothetical protein J0M12_00420 [Deltaproteobacteria bacterium]|nr:hypothetical protein [Deltaproteobacteria bacterium]
MEVIIPLGVPRSFNFDSAVSLARAKLSAPSVQKSVHSSGRDFPDPRLFDFDQNGTVDASDIIQERQIRRLTQAAVEAKTPLSKYAAQAGEQGSEEASPPTASSKEEQSGISILV